MSYFHFNGSFHRLDRTVINFIPKLQIIFAMKIVYQKTQNFISFKQTNIRVFKRLSLTKNPSLRPELGSRDGFPVEELIL